MKVALLHGWPEDDRMWVRQSAALRNAGFEPLVPRLYGRGPSIDGWAAQILRENVGPYVVVGSSMGGYCALALARRAPENVLGMVLVASRPGVDSFHRRRIRDEEIARLRSQGIPPGVDPEITAEDLAVAQEAMRDRFDLTGVFESFGGPILMCVGDQDDVMSVDEARTLADRALRGSLEVFEGAGHFPSVEQPERFNEVLLGFLTQWE